MSDATPIETLPPTESVIPVKIWDPKEVAVALATGEIEQKGGGSTKNVFFPKKPNPLIPEGEIGLILVDNENSLLRKQLESQVEFYKKYNDSPSFKEIVVPMKDVFKNPTGQIIGAAFEVFGESLPQFKAQGGKLSKEQIDNFTQRYAGFVKQSSTAHGDLVYGVISGDTIYGAWDQIRIQGNEIRLTDYNGRGGGIVEESELLEFTLDPKTKPEFETNERYLRHLRQEPDELKKALYKMFGY